MTNGFTIQTEKFVGPFDILLTLIEKRKMPVSDVSLATIAQDYITYINEREEFPVEETASFIYVAATLLLIKSKALLPLLELTEEEQEDVEELENRLKLYRKFRRIALLLRPQWNKQPLLQTLHVPKREAVFAPGTVTVDTLRNTLQQRLKKTQSFFQRVPQVKVKKVVSLEEMIEHLRKRVEKSLTLSFTEFSGMGKRERIDVVVSFLALLELVKQGVIAVQQQGVFSDITLSSTTPTVPQYE